MDVVPQKIESQQVNTSKAMPTISKDKDEVPPFLLSLRIFEKNLHNFFYIFNSFLECHATFDSSKVGSHSSTLKLDSDAT